MAFGNLFKSLFGGSSDSASKAAESEPVEYKGFTIIPAPIKEGGQYRTAGTIRKDVDGEMKEVKFIRADNSASLDAAVEHCLYKGKQIIDEQGEAALEREQV